MSNDTDRLADLKRKLAAREGEPGYAANVQAIKEEIARLEGREPAAPDRLTELRRKLAAREGESGYGANVEALKAEIARLERRD